MNRRMNTRAIKAASELIFRALKKCDVPVSVATALDAAGMLNGPETAAELADLRMWAADQQPPAWQSTGPVGVAVRPLPDGAALELAGLSRCVVEDVLDLLMSTDAPEFRERFDEVESGTAGDLAYERLVSDIADRVSSRVVVRRSRLRELVAVLSRLAVGVPGQRAA